MGFKMQLQHPSAIGMFEEIIEASKGKQIVVFLDYDGTLSPIVEDPEKAFMTTEVCRKTLNSSNFLVNLQQYYL